MNVNISQVYAYRSRVVSCTFALLWSKLLLAWQLLKPPPASFHQYEAEHQFPIFIPSRAEAVHRAGWLQVRVRNMQRAEK